MYRSKLITDDLTTINRINFDLEPQKIIISLEKFDIDFVMHRVENNEYMEINALYMLWFYMYYMDSIKDDKAQLYPVYVIDIGNAEFPQTCKIIMDKLTKESELTQDSELSELSHDSEEDVIVESNS